MQGMPGWNVVLDRCFEQLPPLYIVAGAEQLVVQLHLYSWIHRARRSSVPRVFFGNLQI